jgi:WD40 repeat protein
VRVFSRFSIRFGVVSVVLIGLMMAIPINAQTPDHRTFVDWSTNGSMLSVASGDIVKIIDVTTNIVLNSLPFPTFSEASWSPDNTRIAVAADTEIHIVKFPWNPDITQTTTYPHAAGFATLVSWEPDGQRVAIGSGGFVDILNLSTGQIEISLDHGGDLRAVAWNHGGTLLASVSSNAELRVWNGTTGQYMYLVLLKSNLPVPDENSPGLSLSWSTDDSQIAVGTEEGDAGSVRVWTLTDADSLSEPTISFTGYNAGVTAVAWRPNTRQVVTGSIDGTARIWDVESGQEIYFINAGAAIYSVSWSPDGNCFVYGELEGTIRIIEVPATNLPAFIPTPIVYAKIKSRNRGSMDRLLTYSYVNDGCKP